MIWRIVFTYPFTTFCVCLCGIGIVVVFENPSLGILFFILITGLISVGVGWLENYLREKYERSNLERLRKNVENPPNYNSSYWRKIYNEMKEEYERGIWRRMIEGDKKD